MATAQLSPAEYYDTELQNGDRMTQKEFHRLYERTPEGFKAELIGGIVYVASPVKQPHGINHLPLATLFFFYRMHTLGVEAGDNATILLGPQGQPQPDLYLRILREFGGRSRITKKQYVKGPPELVSEISLSSKAIDLHAKKADYARYGVLEYLVACLKERIFRWFDLQANRELKPRSDGVIRIRTFPGLWIHGPALLTEDFRKMWATLEEGLASPEHAAFVKKLAAARARIEK